MSKTMSLLAVLLLALTAQAAADAAPKPGTPKMPAVPKLQIKASPAPAAAPSKAAPAPAKPVTPAQPSGNPPRLVPEAAPAGVWRYTLRVTAGVVAPDCGGTRKALLINNMFQPTMEVASGDTLEVMVTNNIPSDWVDITNNGSISIHWHGFHLIGNPWYDGTAYIAQCPIPRGQSFLYRFQVNEPEGTYFYHDHAAMNKGDGLQGALIVRPPGTKVGAPPPAGEHILFLSDWWEYTGAAMAIRLNRPFDPAKATSTSGDWCWFGVPRSILINGKGSISDCENVYDRKVNQTMPNGKVAQTADVFNPCITGALGPNGSWPVCKIDSTASAKCKREEISLTPGKPATFRIVNAATLVYMTVCFGGHDVTVTAADARPVAPVGFGECVDLNLGQRLDVTVKPNGTAKSDWLSVTSQYRKGAPSGFAVLRYPGAKAGLPAQPLLQPEEGYARRWDSETTLKLVSPVPKSTVPLKVDRRFVLNTAQPLFPNGYVKWSMDNVINADKPGCSSLLGELQANPKALAGFTKLTPNTSDDNYWLGGKSLTGDGKGVKVLEVNSDGSKALIDAGVLKAGLHTLSLQQNQAIEIVIQNNRAGVSGGEYPSNSSLTYPRNSKEQHPFHLHGFHFWIVGMGLGEWTADKEAGYNLKNPGLRDTATVLFQDTGDKVGWVALRFVASNPGVWPLHCHIAPHAYMGQAVNLVVAPEKIGAPPKNMPKCPKTCTYQMAQWTTPLTQKAWGGNKLLAPPKANGAPYGAVPSEGR